MGVEYISKSKFEVSWSTSASPSSGFGLSWQMKVVTEICLELDYGVIDGVGGHMECLRDRVCPELLDGDILSELEEVVEKGVPYSMDERTVSPVPKTLRGYGFCSFGHRKMYVQPAARYFELIGNSGGAFNWDRKCTSGEFSF